ncbi:MAG: pseudouridine-5-phosphate glycosidase [Planctomycetaceae bacterium]|nr:pseudouridine-5-phosphate glycosidase [Planctomycetaceae bacterium]
MSRVPDGFVRTHPEIADAIASGRPVVGLETAVLTHGLSRSGRTAPNCLRPDGEVAGMLGGEIDWDDDAPLNLQAVRLVSRAVRHAGAVPAIIGMVDGVLRIGLDDDELAALALDESASKVSNRDFAAISVAGGSAGTTVAASMHACRLASPAPIRVFATGGIGGVHRGWTERPDISADLRALASEPVVVVASGAKVILDLPATLEMLDTLGVPVIGYRTDALPIFTVGTSEDLRVPHRLDTVDSVAETCRRHWDGFAQSSGILVANPCPAEDAIDPHRMDVLVDAGLAEAAAQGIDGSGVTPFLLGSMITDADIDPVSANLALLVSNAALAGGIAGAWPADRSG